MKINRNILPCFIAFSTLLAACSIIPVDSPAVTADSTPASLPVEAQVRHTPTSISVEAPVNPPDPAGTAGVAAAPPTSVVILVTTEQPALPSSLANCDQVAPGRPIDVTVQDGARFSPGQGFSKTWRLVNSGDCPWTNDYRVVWFSGQQLGVTGEQNLSQTVGPGESVDLTVDMVAPEAPGVYQSNWKLKNAQGELFGLGPNGNAPFWVQIEVVAGSTATPEQSLSPIPTLPVFLSKMSNLVHNDSLDLDSGELNLDEESDFAYRLGLDGKAEIAPLNNARIALFGAYPPLEMDCQTADLKSTALPFEDGGEGVYLCYRTNRALPGFMRIQQPSPEEGQISVDFVTWTVP